MTASMIGAVYFVKAIVISVLLPKSTKDSPKFSTFKSFSWVIYEIELFTILSAAPPAAEPIRTASLTLKSLPQAS